MGMQQFYTMNKYQSKKQGASHRPVNMIFVEEQGNKINKINVSRVEKNLAMSRVERRIDKKVCFALV